MQIAFLALSAAIYMAYAYLIFGSKMEKSGLTFFLCSMVVGLLYSLLWYWSARLVDDKNSFFFLVLLWDLIYILIFYFGPVLLFGLKLDAWGLAGLIITIAGICTMKLGHFF